MTAFEQQLLELMGRQIEAIDRQTDAFRVATDRQFKFYAGLLTVQKPGEETRSEYPMD